MSQTKKDVVDVIGIAFRLHSDYLVPLENGTHRCMTRAGPALLHVDQEIAPQSQMGTALVNPDGIMGLNPAIGGRIKKAVTVLEYIFDKPKATQEAIAFLDPKATAVWDAFDILLGRSDWLFEEINRIVDIFRGMDNATYPSFTPNHVLSMEVIVFEGPGKGSIVSTQYPQTIHGTPPWAALPQPQQDLYQTLLLSGVRVLFYISEYLNGRRAMWSGRNREAYAHFCNSIEHFCSHHLYLCTRAQGIEDAEARQEIVKSLNPMSKLSKINLALHTHSMEFPGGYREVVRNANTVWRRRNEVMHGEDILVSRLEAVSVQNACRRVIDTQDDLNHQFLSIVRKSLKRLLQERAAS